jgi:DMSO/TMAO reductase YedYZ molybdopterin-dependent catalytic subunit
MADDDIPLTGEVREKLVRTKERWAEEGRLLTGTHGDPERDRLPPGQTLVKDWPVLDLGVQPDVAREKFRLRVEGLVENRIALDWDGFMALPQNEMVVDIHCVTQWSRHDNRFTGVKTTDLLALARPKPGARFVAMTSYDGYTTNLTLADFAAEDVMLVHAFEGRPLERQHGAPVRLVLPKLYFWKSPKWLTRIELLAEDRPGFWEVRGYHNRGDPWTEERYG